MNDRPVVLIIDDDVMVRATIAATVADAGYDPVEFDDGWVALGYLARSGPVAAVLLDWQMPKMSGADVLHRLRDEHYDGPVLVMTGDARNREPALATGADAVFDKAGGPGPMLDRLHRDLEHPASAQSAPRARPRRPPRPR